MPVALGKASDARDTDDKSLIRGLETFLENACKSDVVVEESPAKKRNADIVHAPSAPMLSPYKRRQESAREPCLAGVYPLPVITLTTYNSMEVSWWG